MHIEIEIIGNEEKKEMIAYYILELLKVTPLVGYNYKVTRENSNSITETRSLHKDADPEC